MNPDNFYLNDVSGSKWTLTHQANILYLPCVDPNILYLPCVDPNILYQPCVDPNILYQPCVDPNKQTFSTCHVLTPAYKHSLPAMCWPQHSLPAMCWPQQAKKTQERQLWSRFPEFARQRWQKLNSAFFLKKKFFKLLKKFTNKMEVYEDCWLDRNF